MSARTTTVDVDNGAELGAHLFDHVLEPVLHQVLREMGRNELHTTIGALLGALVGTLHRQVGVDETRALLLKCCALVEQGEAIASTTDTTKVH